MNTSKPLISIIIPNYNYAHFIGETLQALADQKNKNFELVVVDDASTDKSVEIIEKYAPLFPFFKFIQNQENKGVAFSTNLGVGNSSCEYVSFGASDDLLLPDYFTEYEQVILRDKPKMICSKYAYFIDHNFSKSTSLDLLKTQEIQNLSPKTLVKTIRKNKFWIPGNTVCVQKELFVKSGGYDVSFGLHMDWFVFLKIGFQYGLTYIPKTLCLMRKHSSSFNQAASDQDRISAYENMLDDLILSENKVLKRAFIKSHSFYELGNTFFTYLKRSKMRRSYFDLRLWVRFIARSLKS